MTNGMERPGLNNYTYHFHRVDIRFVGGDPNAEISAEGESEDYTNYYTDITGEAGATFIRSYSTVTYTNVWPNVDVRFNSTDEGFKYDVIVRPGGDLSGVRFRVDGAEVSESLKGRLVFTWADGSMEEMIPDSWVENGRRKERVNAQYRLDGNKQFGFAVDRPIDGTLVIDPTYLLSWSTYYGGSGSESSGDVAVDGSGNVYMCGYTSSAANIATLNAHDVTYSAISDGMIVKFNASGPRAWGTYYGGTGSDACAALVAHPSGYVVAGGRTTSTSVMATAGAHQSVKSTGEDGFLAKFTTTGLRIWGTYYGGMAATRSTTWTWAPTKA